MGNARLALEASRLSGQYVEQGNKAAWLDLFADDACVQDPVGVSPLDPEGCGHTGKSAIANFWDTVIAAGDIDFTIVSSHPAGDECANVVKMVNTLAGGITMQLDMVVVYRANDLGKIVSLKAYWDFEAVQQQLS
ncbi:Steroid Delta-isomerase [Zhongshania aliphaticivorans]|uniref:Steroid Delta-isomerase n=1 Tax=Zhongshania aliphaticivorans TaxID=1470434 RepID=A0A5S9QNK0_9GAMM|nr:nuclear transport factor 2 family protein [Zhongshania aliphaticivorans]CAA0087582.1 Steroid Delta-isomerase [Zhongshania aliphaticivorans]CAA0115142.1 Steroid Delta-isomerase [Zhongshania aliphaticivorans]CAA0120000.1 Steroid Delta-isomerase [Zhongshania aliphaticivorans]